MEDHMDGWMDGCRTERHVGESQRQAKGDKDAENVLLVFSCHGRTAAVSLSHSPPRFCGFLSSRQVKMQARILNRTSFSVGRQVWTLALFSLDVFIEILWWESWPVRMTLLYRMKSRDCY